MNKNVKSVLVVGLSRFGRQIGQKLCDLGHEVMAVDLKPERVANALPYLTNGLIGDATNEAFVRGLDVQDFDMCVVAVGDDFQVSLEATALLKDLGAKFILARAVGDVHGKFLLRNGADKVVYPEKQTANWAAVRYSSDDICDYIELPGAYSIFEIEIPKDWVGKTIAELAVRQKYNINILGIHSGTSMNMSPSPVHKFKTNEKVMVVGADADLARFLISK